MPKTPLEATEVRYGRFGPYDHNVVDVAMPVYFAETPWRLRRRRMTLEISKIFAEWDQALPKFWSRDTALDIFWGHSNGRLNIRGKVTTW